MNSGLGNKLILYGAGNVGAEALDYFGERSVAFFADSNPEKHGELYYGKRVLSGKEAKIYAENGYTVIITGINYAAIAHSMHREGINSYYVFSHILNFEKLASLGVDIYGEKTALVYHTLSFNLDKLLAAKGVANAVANDECSFMRDKAGKLNIMNIEKDDLSGIETFIIADNQLKYILRQAVSKNAKPGAKIIGSTENTPFRNRTGMVSFAAFKENNKIDEMSMAHENLSMNVKQGEEMRKYVEAVKDNVPLFNFIEVETVNRCNGTCAFCPVNAKAKQREKAVMPEPLYKKIVDELARLNYCGYFAPFSNNEPLLDLRLEAFILYARKMLPNAFIYFFTNGTLLTVERFKQIIDNVDEICVDNYCKEGKLIETCRLIVEEAKNNMQWAKKVHINIRNPHEIMLTRGGDAPNRSIMPSYGGFTCAYPFNQMVVRPDGKVSLCCNDALGRHTMGDLSNQSIIDVWYGEKYKKLREAIVKGRKYVGQCEKCDSLFMKK